MQEKFEFNEVWNNDFLKKYETKHTKEINLNIKVITNDNSLYKENFTCTTLDECINYIKDKEVLSVDIETTRKFNGTKSNQEGLDPYLSKIVMFQIGDKNTQFIIDTRTIDIQKLVELLPNKTVVGHNLKFAVICGYFLTIIDK